MWELRALCIEPPEPQIPHEPVENPEPIPGKSERNATSAPTVNGITIPEAEAFSPQTFSDFQARTMRAKQPLIDTVLYSRDRIALTGRRRHGKTTIISNIAFAGALKATEYLGFKIPRPFSTVAFYLEDDETELKIKLDRMAQGVKGIKLFHLYTREDFWRWRIPIDVKDTRFVRRVLEACDAAKPDLVTFDNLGHLIGADYNNPTAVHALMNDLIFPLQHLYNAAVLIAAHPRKGSRVNDDADEPISLVKTPELFFEETMGSSHFINTTGSLWGVERDYNTERSHLCLGSQRFTGARGSFTLVEKDDADWFHIVNDLMEAGKLALNTPKRKEAWSRLPESDFTYVQARDVLVKGVMAGGTFNDWWKELVRLHLIVPHCQDGRPTSLYMKNPACAGSGGQK